MACSDDSPDSGGTGMAPKCHKMTGTEREK
jgi:hypothetical protein